MPTSKPLRAWAARAPQVVLDPHAAWHEPTRRAELLLRSRSRAGARRTRRRRRAARPARDPDWLDGWRAADAVACRLRWPRRPTRSSRSCSPRSSPSCPTAALVWLSSSMPIRDVEAFFPQSPKRLRFLANRGANGIDGVVSSAAGAALAERRRRPGC